MREISRPSEFWLNSIVRIIRSSLVDLRVAEAPPGILPPRNRLLPGNLKLSFAPPNQAESNPAGPRGRPTEFGPFAGPFSRLDQPNRFVKRAQEIFAESPKIPSPTTYPNQSSRARDLCQIAQSPARITTRSKACAQGWLAEIREILAEWALGATPGGPCGDRKRSVNRRRIFSSGPGRRRPDADDRAADG